MFAQEVLETCGDATAPIDGWGAITMRFLYFLCEHLLLPSPSSCGAIHAIHFSVPAERKKKNKPIHFTRFGAKAMSSKFRMFLKRSDFERITDFLPKARAQIATPF